MEMSQRDIEAIRRCLERWQFQGAEPDWDTFNSIFGNRSQRYWQLMCESYDWHNAPEEFPAGQPTGVVIY